LTGLSRGLLLLSGARSRWRSDPKGIGSPLCS
jgi:hypothetical protein